MYQILLRKVEGLDPFMNVQQGPWYIFIITDPDNNWTEYVVKDKEKVSCACYALSSESKEALTLLFSTLTIPAEFKQKVLEIVEKDGVYHFAGADYRPE